MRISWHFVLSTWKDLNATKSEANETLASTKRIFFDRKMFQLLLKDFIYSRNAVYVMSTSVIIFYLEWVSVFHVVFFGVRVFLMRALLFMVKFFFSTLPDEKKSIKYSLPNNKCTKCSLGSLSFTFWLQLFYSWKHDDGNNNNGSSSSVGSIENVGIKFWT